MEDCNIHFIQIWAENGGFIRTEVLEVFYLKLHGGFCTSTESPDLAHFKTARVFRAQNTFHFRER